MSDNLTARTWADDVAALRKAEADNTALRERVAELEAALEQCSDMCRWRSSDHYATCEDNCKLGRAEECPANIPRILARGGADEGSEF